MIQTPIPLWQFWIFDRFIYNRKQTRKNLWVPDIIEEMRKMDSRGIFRIKTYRTAEDEGHFSFAVFDYIDQLGLLNILKQLGYKRKKNHEILCDTLPPLTGKDVHNDIAYYMSTVDPSDPSINLPYEKLESISLYGEMIYKQMESTAIIKPKPKILDKQLVSVVEFTNNLIHADQKLANDWERSFVANMLSLLLNGNEMTEKQHQIIIKIKNRVEKELGISLTYQ
jgi:competence protein CoiA